MSKEVFSSEIASRVNSYLIDPREILIREEFNGRHEEPEVDDLIEDFMNPSVGQIVPVTITKDDGSPVLLAGHRRWRAAIEVTKRKQGPFDGIFKLKCVYFRGTPLECFVLTVRENLNRKEVSPLSEGWNISKFRNFGMSDEDIAVKVYSRKTLDGKPDIRWIEDRAAMIDLAPEALAAVVNGHVKPSAVAALAKMKKQAQRDLVKDNAGKITTAVIKRASTPSPQETTSEASPTPTAKRKWDKKAFCELIQTYIDADLPPHTAKMSAENAVRTVLGQIQEEIECGQ